MTLSRIECIFQCDGCGRGFIIEMDPATEGTAGWSLHAEAEDALRGGSFRGFTDEKNRQLPANWEPTLASIQSGQHLCPGCTYKVDSFVKPDRDATVPEIQEALARPSFPSDANPDEGGDEHDDLEYYHDDNDESLDC